MGLKFVASRCPEHLPCIDCYPASIVCYSSYNQTRLHVIDTRSQQLNMFLNTRSPFLVSYITNFVRMLHRMYNCLIVLLYYLEYYNILLYYLE